MSKTVLTARPHTFIVLNMKPLLEDGGLSKDDLTSPARGNSAARLVQRHFR